MTDLEFFKGALLVIIAIIGIGLMLGTVWLVWLSDARMDEEPDYSGGVPPHRPDV